MNKGPLFNPTIRNDRGIRMYVQRLLTFFLLVVALRAANPKNPPPPGQTLSNEEYYDENSDDAVDEMTDVLMSPEDWMGLGVNLDEDGLPLLYESFINCTNEIYDCSDTKPVNFMKAALIESGIPKKIILGAFIHSEALATIFWANGLLGPEDGEAAWEIYDYMMKDKVFEDHFWAELMKAVQVLKGSYMAEFVLRLDDSIINTMDRCCKFLFPVLACLTPELLNNNPQVREKVIFIWNRFSWLFSERIDHALAEKKTGYDYQEVLRGIHTCMLGLLRGFAPVHADMWKYISLLMRSAITEKSLAKHNEVVNFVKKYGQIMPQVVLEEAISNVRNDVFTHGRYKAALMLGALANVVPHLVNNVELVSECISMLQPGNDPLTAALLTVLAHIIRTVNLSEYECDQLFSTLAKITNKYHNYFVISSHVKEVVKVIWTKVSGNSFRSACMILAKGPKFFTKDNAMAWLDIWDIIACDNVPSSARALLKKTVRHYFELNNVAYTHYKKRVSNILEKFGLGFE